MEILIQYLLHSYYHFSLLRRGFKLILTGWRTLVVAQPIRGRDFSMTLINYYDSTIFDRFRERMSLSTSKVQMIRFAC